MKNKKINIGILFVMIVLVLYLTLKDDFSGIIKQISNTDYKFFLLAILIFLLSLLFKSASLFTFIREYDSNYSVKNAYQLTLISQFLNGITPFQSGGQPFEIYLLRKQNIRITDSTNALIKDFISFQIALIIIGIFSILLNLNLGITSKTPYLKWVVFIGFVINTGVLLVLLIFLIAKKTGRKIGLKFINFIYRFKIINKIPLTKEKAINGIEHFYEASDTLRKSKFKIFIGVMYNIIHLVLLYLVPLIIFKSLGFNNISILDSIVATSFVMLIGNFVPIPGATGGIEYGFIQFFGVYVKGVILSSAMLLWRTITYFLAMVIGAVLLLFKKEDKKI